MLPNTGAIHDPRTTTQQLGYTPGCCCWQGQNIRYTTRVNDKPTTITDTLAAGRAQLHATSPTPRLDAELLLAHVLSWPRARLLAEGRTQLTTAHQAAFSALIERRRALEPVAYLIGHREFYGLDFVVDPRVLVPRPETELLVELALGFAQQLTVANHNSHSSTSSVVIADIGTGSGSIAVALAVHIPTAQIIATDISPDALAVAQLNAARHGVGARIALHQGDLLAPLDEPVDLLVSNPPYTILSEIDAGVRRYEPHRALDGGSDGLELYRRLLAAAPARLRPGGVMLLEIGATQGAAVVALAQQAFPAALRIHIHKDLAGLDRVVTIET